jgi:REP element-mobilizing transposase RayT
MPKMKTKRGAAKRFRKNGGGKFKRNQSHRGQVETVCAEHAQVRGWQLHAVSARTNHVHLVVTADRAPNIVRDQFKANATRVLREGPDPIMNQRIWTRGGDVEVVNGQESLEQVILYVTEAQERMGRGK